MFLNLSIISARNSNVEMSEKMKPRYFSLWFSFLFDIIGKSFDRIFASTTIMVEDIDRRAIKYFYQIFQEDEFKQALFIYTLEIGVDPSNVGFYVDRALAKIELENFLEL